MQLQEKPEKKKEKSTNYRSKL